MKSPNIHCNSILNNHCCNFHMFILATHWYRKAYMRYIFELLKVWDTWLNTQSIWKERTYVEHYYIISSLLNLKIICIVITTDISTKFIIRYTTKLNVYIYLESSIRSNRNIKKLLLFNMLLHHFLSYRYNTVMFIYFWIII